MISAFETFILDSIFDSNPSIEIDIEDIDFDSIEDNDIIEINITLQ